MCRQFFTVMISLQENRPKVNGINNIQSSPRRGFFANPVNKSESFQQYKPKFNAFGLAAKRASDGAKLGLRLRGAAIEAKEIESIIDSDLMVSLSKISVKNHAVFENKSDYKNRAFTAATAFVSSGARVDAVSGRKASYKARKALQTAFLERESDIISGKVFPFFITPTFKNLENTDFVTNFLFLLSVWTRFRNTPYFREVIDGCYRKIEFTVKDAETKNYNFHPHLLGLTTVEFADNSKDCKPNCRESHQHRNGYKVAVNVEFSNVWTKCLQLSHKEMFGCEIDLSGLETAVCDFRKFDINDVRTVERRGVLFELTKYMAKPSDFLELEPTELLAANKILKGKRLLTSIGSFNDYKGRAVFNKQRAYEDWANRQYMKMKEKYNDNERFYRQNFLTMKSGTYEDSVRENSVNNLLNDIRKRKEINKLERRQRGKRTDDERGFLAITQLRKLGRELNSSNVPADREKWLKLLDENLTLMVGDARKKFLQRHPDARITTLDGQIYLGDVLKRRELESRTGQAMVEH
jgi:hypothetical protein